MSVLNLRVCDYGKCRTPFKDGVVGFMVAPIPPAADGPVILNGAIQDGMEFDTEKCGRKYLLDLEKVRVDAEKIAKAEAKAKKEAEAAQKAAAAAAKK
jgi:hypothetical protein